MYVGEKMLLFWFVPVSSSVYKLQICEQNIKNVSDLQGEKYYYDFLNGVFTVVLVLAVYL